MIKTHLLVCFFQDGIMKRVFAAYPEVLLIDATYKLYKLQMPIYLFLVIDSNGQSEIIGVFITLLDACSRFYTKIVSSFKSHNSDWNLIITKVVMSDKDFTEHTVFLTEFLQLHCLLVSFTLYET